MFASGEVGCDEWWVVISPPPGSVLRRVGVLGQRQGSLVRTPSKETFVPDYEVSILIGTRRNKVINRRLFRVA
jgi:hypothetical protein